MVGKASDTAEPVESAHHIHPGDYVGTKYRGGTREGFVESVSEGKATFVTQRGARVSHKLDTLAKDPLRSPDDGSDEAVKQHLAEEWEREIGVPPGGGSE